MKKIFILLVAIMATLAVNAAETIDLGELKLDTDYALASFKNYQGTYTPEKSGVLTFSTTTTDELKPYSDEAHTQAVEVTNNGNYGAHTYDMNVEAGKTYYFYASFVMNTGTVVRFTMADSQDLTLESSSPELGGVYNVSNGGQISFNFNKAVSFTDASIAFGSVKQSINCMVTTSSIFTNDVKDIIWNALTSGTINPGDEFTITVNGIAMAADKNILYDGTGTLVAKFKVGNMPLTLTGKENTSGTFLSYYTLDNESGTVKLTFSGKVNPEKLLATIKYGNIDEDASGEYYVEYLTPTLSEDGTTVIVNLQGKRRRPVDMVASGKDYGTITLGITGVTDYDGNYAYSPESGSMGSYWYEYAFKEISANVVAEFTPSNGADISNTDKIEIWITDEDKLSYDGINLTYSIDGISNLYIVPNSDITKEQDPDDPTAKILTFAIPDEVKTAKNVNVTFENLQCADGTDYSDILRVKYNAFVITRTIPVANSTIEKLSAGQQIKVFTNMDSSFDKISISLCDPSKEEGFIIFTGTAEKNDDGKGFTFTCPRNYYLEKGHEYDLTAFVVNGSFTGSDYVVYHGAAVKKEDFFMYGYDASGIALTDTLASGTATISGFSNGKHTGSQYGLLEMPANVSNTMDGCQITRVAFYPFLTSQISAKIIISNEIGGTPLYEQEVNDIQSQTWQIITLDTPFTINKDEHYFIGYSIEGAAGDYPIGYYYTTDIMEGGTIDPILDYIAYTVDGTTSSGLIDTQMYSARRQLANLMLYATIEAPLGDLPQNAVAIGTPSLSTDVYVKPNTETTLTCLYNNTATQPLSSFKATIKDGDNVMAEQTVTLEKELQPMEEGKLSVKLPTSEVGCHKITVTIDEPNGEANAYTGSKTANKNYLVYDETVKRNVLLEHFTTGQCTNCVAGEEKVVNELAKVSDDINVIRINHHSGFGSDKLTTTDDTAYEWFYGGTYVWAPANMIDRTDLEAYGAKGYGGTATLGPVFGTDKSAAINKLITSASKLPAFINIDVEAKADENRELTVTVKADELYEMPQADIMMLNVALVEDSVKAAQTLSDGTVDKSFIHYNVSRENLTGTWGELAEFEGNSLDRTFTTTLKTKYNIDNLRVVAFIADYDATNIKNCRVYNVAECKVLNITEGIENIDDDSSLTAQDPSLYNIAGQRVGENYHGVVIKNGKKYINK